jgi:putative DNA primase/helicase
MKSNIENPTSGHYQAAVPTNPGDAKKVPTIVVDDKQLSSLEKETWKMVLDKNNRPEIFRKDGRLYHLVPLNDRPQLTMMKEIDVLGFLIRKANWVKMSDGVLKPAVPPGNLTRLLLALPHDCLPPIESVVCSPVFGKNGRLIDSEGYHEDDQVWFHPMEQLTLPEVSEKPGKEEVEKAKTLILEELFGDFPFVSPSDQAHAVAALLLPFVRRMIDGPTPLHVVEAPTCGSGKSLLCKLIGQIATGNVVEACSLPRSSDEMKKLITSELLHGEPVILLDNAIDKIDNASLASVLTAPVWTDRILGRSLMVSAPNTALWMLTANNPRLSMEIARRSLRLRIDPRMDQPWRRQTFRHKNIEEWVREHRSDLVHTVLTLVRAWLAEGKPLNSTKLGSFENWSGVVGGILQVVGIPGFLENLDSLYEDADVDGQMWREFVGAWFSRFQDALVPAQDLNQMCVNGDLMTEIRGSGNEQSQRSKLGRALKQAKDRIFGDFKITSEFRKNENANLYRLLCSESHLQN